MRSGTSERLAVMLPRVWRSKRRPPPTRKRAIDAEIAHHGQASAGRWWRTASTRATRVEMPTANTAVGSTAPNRPDAARRTSAELPAQKPGPRRQSAGSARPVPSIALSVSETVLPGFTLSADLCGISENTDHMPTTIQGSGPFTACSGVMNVDSGYCDGAPGRALRALGVGRPHRTAQGGAARESGRQDPGPSGPDVPSPMLGLRITT